MERIYATSLWTPHNLGPGLSDKLWTQTAGSFDTDNISSLAVYPLYPIPHYGRFTKSLQLNVTTIYTDGSQSTEGVGAGVILPPPLQTIQLKLHQECSAFQAELLAILYATKFTMNFPKEHFIIASDCQSALSAICRSWPPRTQLIAEIIYNLHFSPNVQLCWIKGHSGIQGNELADQAAKAAAHSNLPLSFTTLPKSVAHGKKEQIALKMWIDLYIQDYSTRNLRRFAATPETTPPNASKHQAWIYLHNNPDRPWLHSGRPCNEDPTCPHCQDEDQTVDHLLFTCSTFQYQRFQTATLLGITNICPASLENLSRKKSAWQHLINWTSPLALYINPRRLRSEGHPGIFQGLISTLQLVEKLDRYPLRNKRKIDSVESDETSMNVKTEAGIQVINYVVQHLPRNPSIFSGEDGEDLQKWLKGYVRVAKYNHWDETLCLTKVYFYLSGTALKWFENNKESIQNWKEFPSQLENKLKTRAQLKGESTEFYIQDVVCFCKEADSQMSEEDKISHLMKGIAEELYQALRCRRVTPTKYERLPNVASLCDQDDGDLSSLIRKIVREEIKQALDSPQEEPKIAVIEDLVREEIVKTLAPRSKPTISPPQASRTRFKAQTIRPHPEPHYRKLGKRCDTNEWRTTEGKPICFYCGRPGHVVRYCRDRKRHNEERRNEYFQRKQDAMEFYNSQTESQEPYDESSRKSFSRYRSPTPYTGRNRQNSSPARRSSWSPRHEN
ncbi:hypothetical protein LAZ67_15001001 [Cordylochernes scorpioides]|uniref:RNase H type-1 domain-containing protein n=1 Tax=Cordylochernes scorpioides TaxID=51811 RepID=A0ABY6LD82_9ARAC|nr:hypothetical protein LAZ67_15001001 [Cordylochernes scorpioides]